MKKDYTQEPYRSLIDWANREHFKGCLGYNLASFRIAYKKRLELFPSPFAGLGRLMGCLDA